MKRLFSILLLCTIFLAGCGTTETEQSFKTDVAVSELSAQMTTASGIENLMEADQSWVALNVEMDPDNWEESKILISAEGSADMMGIFKATDIESAEAALAEAEDYIQKLEDNWMTEYLPEELPKIQNAVCKRNGLYVTFIIFEDSARNSALEKFDSILKG